MRKALRRARTGLPAAVALVLALTAGCGEVDDGGDGDGETATTEGADGGEGESNYTFEGSGTTNTETANLVGDYEVSYSYADNSLEGVEVNFIATLMHADDELDLTLIVNEIASESEGSTNAYGLDGDYYLEVVAEGDWSFEFARQ